MYQQALSRCEIRQNYADCACCSRLFSIICSFSIGDVLVMAIMTMIEMVCSEECLSVICLFSQLK